MRRHHPFAQGAARNRGRAFVPADRRYCTCDSWIARSLSSAVRAASVPG
jgi:hypothetical protein